MLNVNSPPVLFEYTLQVERPAVYSPDLVDVILPSAVIRYDPVALKTLNSLQSKMSALEKKIDRISAILDQGFDGKERTASKASISALMSDADIIAQARQMFDSAGDETVYPSDLADALEIPYEKAIEIFEVLEKSGKIKKA